MIKMLMKKYNCNYIKVMPGLDVLKSGAISNLDLKNQIGDKFCNKWEYKK